MGVGDRLPAVLAIGIVIVHVGRHRTRPIEGNQRCHIVEARWRKGPHQRPHGTTLELKHANRVAPLQHREHCLVGKVHVVDVGFGPGRLLNHVQAAFNDRKVPQTQEVHLEQAQLFDTVHLELRHHRRVLDVARGVRLALDRQVLGQRISGDHHRRRMNTVTSSKPLEPLGHRDDALGNRVGVVHFTKLRRRDVAIAEALDFLEAGFERRVPAHQQRRHGLGHPVAGGVVVAEHSRCVADRRSSLDGGEGDDLGHVVRAIAIGGVLDHLAAVALVEVHVDVRHLLAAGVQEPLEEQVVLDRVKVHDAEAVGHAAPCGRPTPWTDSDARFARVADQIPHHEEVSRESHIGDDPKLVVEALDHFVGKARPVALASTLVGELAQVLSSTILIRGTGDLVGDWELRETWLAEFEANVGSLGDEQRRVTGRLVILKEVPHLGGGLQVVLGAVELEALLIGEQRTRLDTQEGIVRLCIAAMGVVAVIGGEQRRADGVGDLDQLRVGLDLLGQPVILQLHEEVVLAEDFLEPGGSRQGFLLIAGKQRLEHHAAKAAGGGDEALSVPCQQLPVNPRLVVVALEVGR